MIFNNLKMINTKSLLWKVLSSFFVILMFILITMELSQYYNMKRYLYKGKEEILESRFHNIQVKELIEIRTQDDLIKNASYIMQSIIDRGMNVAIINNKGNIIESTGRVNDNIQFHHDGKDDEKNLEYFKKFDVETPLPKLSEIDYNNILKTEGTLDGFYKLVKDVNNEYQLVTWRKIGNLDSPSGLIQCSIVSSDIKNILNSQLYTYIIASIIIIIIGISVGVLVLKKTLKPLKDMTDTVQIITVGELNTRLLEDSGQYEVDMLSEAFNKMLERIETSFEQEHILKEKMRKFVSDASHELRTPLTSIHGFVEVLLRGAAKNEEQLNLALNSILTESERLTKLVNDLLLLNKLDQQSVVKMDIENLSEIVNELYPHLKVLSGERTIDLDIQDNLLITSNNGQIKQIIYNLVQNAINHTDQKNGVINIAAKKSNKYSNNFILLEIKDNGIGIPAENIDEIFNRFYRGDSHRSRKSGGYGLGLSIVKSIIDSQNGKIDVESQLEKGTTFSIYFRRADL